VTAPAVVGERRFECSQAGVFEAGPDGPRLLADPGFRPFALAGRAGDAQRTALLLVGGGKPAQSGELALLDLDGSIVARSQLAQDLVYAVALAPGHDQAAAACADGVVRLLRLPDLAPQPTSWRHAGPAVAVAFSHDGTLMASGGHDGVVLLGTPGAESPRALLDHTAAVTCLSWTPDGRLASGARDGKVRLHDRSGRLLHTWQRLGGAITQLAVRADQIECTMAAAPGSQPASILLALP
jgi:WD40 repeat protein